MPKAITLAIVGVDRAGKSTFLKVNYGHVKKVHASPFARKLPVTDNIPWMILQSGFHWC